MMSIAIKPTTTKPELKSQRFGPANADIPCTVLTVQSSHHPDRRLTARRPSVQHMIFKWCQPLPLKVCIAVKYELVGRCWLQPET